MTTTGTAGPPTSTDTTTAGTPTGISTTTAGTTTSTGTTTAGTPTSTGTAATGTATITTTPSGGTPTAIATATTTPTGTRNIEFIVPVRVVDMRPISVTQNIQTTGYDQNGVPIQPGPIQGGTIRRFSIAGRTFPTAGGGAYTVPTDVSGVVINVTIVGGSGGGFVTVFPGDVPDANRPNASTLNPVTPIAFNLWTTGLPRSPSQNAGSIAVYSTDTLHLVIDLVAIYR